MWQQAFRDINEFERMLADDGTVILKFFLHISKKEQCKRFEMLEADPMEAWRVTKDDWARHKKYDQYLAATEEMLELTDSEYAPWTIIPATSKSYTRKCVFETIISALERQLGPKAPPPDGVSADVSKDAELRAAMDSLSEGRL
jgi:polyphosphate kinase 2 (PPK2 family)